MAKRKIGILTGGGDAPGLNAVIYAFVRSCLRSMDCEIIGYKFGYRGLYNNDFKMLDIQNTSGILHRGGTILHSSNKDNLFEYMIEKDGRMTTEDVSGVAIENMKKEGVDSLVILGGDGTLTSARDFARKGINVVGVPKTIDNDLGSTDTTFGFDTAVAVVTENLGRLHTTAESHHRVMVVEVMGRSAGWIALHSGIAGSADVILLPEYPYNLEKIVKKINFRNEIGRPFTVIVVGEGAREKGKEVTVSKIVADSPDPVRFGGIAAKLAYELEPFLVENEVRSCALGHIQRGGEPTPHDRVLSARYGIAAAELITNGDYGKMVALREGKMTSVSLEEVIGQNKYVQKDDQLIKVALNLGITFATEEIDDIELKI